MSFFTYFGSDKGKSSVKVLLPDSSSRIIYRKWLYPLADGSLLDRGAFRFLQAVISPVLLVTLITFKDTVVLKQDVLI